jgi:N-acyl-D-amino-acid deacylase
MGPATTGNTEPVAICWHLPPDIATPIPIPLESRMLFRTGLVLALASLPSLAQSPPAYDVILSGGKIVDGTGNPWFYGDLAIRGGRIAKITAAGALDKTEARERIDVHGLVVAPGFLDIQGGTGGKSIGKITQGVTSEFSGEGTTAAPANDRTRAGGENLGRAIKDKAFDGPHGFDAMLKTRQAAGSAVNFGSYVGASTVRQYVKGLAQGHATSQEIAEMQNLVRLAMEDGAFGVGSAMIYPPGVYADEQELAAITKPAGDLHGIYISHIRSEADNFLEALDEAIAIGKKAGTPVEIYHLKASGKRNWSKEAAALAKIDAARAAGQDVGACMYPYTAGATGLTSVLPPWTSADGKLFENLADPAIRARIKTEMAMENTDWENMGLLAGPEGILLTTLEKPENKPYVGKRLSEIATMQGKDWRDAAMDIILTEHTRVETTYFMMSEENVQLQIRKPWMKFGVDAGGADPEELKAQDRLVHPRTFGTFPRILGRYVRDEKILTLEDAIRKMTSAVARRLSIYDRGLLQEGLAADVTVFNPDTIIDVATYEDPDRLSIGVEHVFVNGIAVMRAGKVTGAMPGVALRGPGYKPVPAQ